jgi:hypothetical protein
VTQNIGPSRFSHNDRNDDMLETASPRPGVSPSVEQCLDQTQKLEFLRVYHLAVSIRCPTLIS